jgi:hypothetical protein
MIEIIEAEKESNNEKLNENYYVLSSSSTLNNEQEISNNISHLKSPIKILDIQPSQETSNLNINSSQLKVKRRNNNENLNSKLSKNTTSLDQQQFKMNNSFDNSFNEIIKESSDIDENEPIDPRIQVYAILKV